MTRVLVIDDHPIVLQGCQQLLEDAGVEQIVQAETLADGFRLYRNAETGRDHRRLGHAHRRARRAILHPPATPA